MKSELTVHFVSFDDDEVWAREAQRSHWMCESVFTYHMQWAGITARLTRWPADCVGLSDRTQRCVVTHVSATSLPDVAKTLRANRDFLLLLSGGLVDPAIISALPLSCSKCSAISHIALDDSTLIEWLLTWQSSGFSEEAFIPSLAALQRRSELIEDVVGAVDQAITQFATSLDGTVMTLSKNRMLISLVSKLATHLERWNEAEDVSMRGALQLLTTSELISLDALWTVKRALILRGAASALYDEYRWVLHDNVAQTLVGLQFVSQLCEENPDCLPELARKCLEKCPEIILECRRLVRSVRQSGLPLHDMFDGPVEAVCKSCAVMIEISEQTQQNPEFDDTLASSLSPIIKDTTRSVRTLQSTFWRIFDWHKLRLQ